MRYEYYEERPNGTQAHRFPFRRSRKNLAWRHTAYDAVRVTLGPRSKSVLIEKTWGTPIVCNDGVTIVKEFDLKDPEENLGARMLRQAAERTSDIVGDGTSTATILAHAMFADGVRNVVAGASAIDIKRGLDGVVDCARYTAADSRSITV